MKIAFVNQPMDGVIPPQQNSIGIWTYQVARRLAQTETVSVYAKRMRTQNQWHGQDNVTYHFIQATPNRVMNKVTPLMGKLYRDIRRPFFASSLFFKDYTLQIARHLRRQQCDIIHIHNFSQFVPPIRAFNPHAKIILHMNGEWLSQLDKAMIAKRIQQVDMVWGSSNYITEKVRQRFPQFAQRCHTVFNGVDTEIFTPPATAVTSPPPYKLLFVGRVSPEKGLHILLQAFTQVTEQIPQTHLTIIGPPGSLPKGYIIDLSDDPLITSLAPLYDQDYWTYLQQQVPTHLQEKVTFTGAMPQTHLLHHYHQAHILINPSYSESFGMSLAEAMATATPVIATRVGGMVELVTQGETGMLIPAGNAEALALAIIHLLQDSPLRQKMGSHGPQRVAQLFSWDQVAQSALQKYQQLHTSHQPTI